MDCFNIPACALFSRIGTVIIRNKMEVLCSCSQKEASPVTSECPRVLDRLSHCELCSRTRLDSQFSDCDSDNMVKSRPYRSSIVSRKYVNVCAAVCLILLVGGLSPQSSAAPSRSRSKMERQKRATGSEENPFWANPCDYNDSSSISALTYEPSLAKQVASQARSAFRSASEYKDNFASELHSFPSFDSLLKSWTEHKYLGTANFPWLDQKVLPMDVILSEKFKEADLDKLMENIDEALPIMYKALKVIVAGLYKVSNEVLNENVNSDQSLKAKIVRSMHDVRGVLCLFSDIMRSRNLEIMPVSDSEIPASNIGMALLVYRDTLYYLEFLGKVFQKMYDGQIA